jgi:hypothetical protein
LGKKPARYQESLLHSRTKRKLLLRAPLIQTQRDRMSLDKMLEARLELLLLQMERRR